MKGNFNDCLNRLLKDEGGYTNNPKDPGGPTNFGITLTDYRKYISKDGVALDVKRMTRSQAAAIYKAKYWDALGCDDLPSGVDYCVFDYGVNSGLGRPRKALQRFKSLSGSKLVDAICNERMAFLRGLNTFSTFGKGWSRRVEGVRAYSKTLLKDRASGPIVGAGTLSVGASISQFWHNHEALIISCSVAAAILIGIAVHRYRNRNKGK